MELLIILTVIVIVFIGIKYQAKKKSKIIINEIQSQYLNLNKIVLPLYNWENCPKCGENVMNIRRLSPTGKSIEYSCEYCDKVITSKLIEGKNPHIALKLIEDIKSNMQKLNELIGDKVFEKEIDISFTINSIDIAKKSG